MVRYAGMLALFAGFATVSVGCAADVAPPVVRNLDRPTAVAFSCHGDLRITNGDPVDSTQQVVLSAQPTSSCATRARGEVPEGQEDGPVSPNFLAFVLQSSKGTVAVVQYPTFAGGISSGGVQDIDPLAPGKNAIPIGTLPVGIAASPNGCHMITANAGSCDLSVLDVNSAMDSSRPALISRVGIQGTNGPLLARPREILTEPAAGQVGVECSDEVEGIVYVSYPHCNLVAAIDPKTGSVVAGIKFEDNGVVTITDGDVSCDAECGDGAIVSIAKTAAGPAPVSAADRPGAIEMSKDGSRLFIGAENNPAVTIVNLDAGRLPTATSRVTVEGDVTIQNLAVSEVIKMGGTLGSFGIGNAGEMQFVYAIASDRTVRVLEVKLLNTECDTQVDPRAIHDVTDVTLLSCLPVSVGYRRRPGARSPGIHVPDDAVPLDITIASVDNGGETLDGEVSATAMVGHFAFLTVSTGFIYIINVDDDKAPDFEDVADPTATTMTLAMAHQLRDFGFNRNAIAGIDSDGGDDGKKCTFPGAEVNFRGPRTALTIGALVSDAFVSIDHQQHLLPTLRHDVCISEDDISVAVSELSFMADVSQRELAFPDLGAILNEQWTLVWEGILSEDTSTENIDGPQIRLGVIDGSNGVNIRDASNPFCALGVEPYDIAILVGCDPFRGDAECGIGETCFSHPDSPPNTRGMCLPTAELPTLRNTCRDVLVSRRRYSVVDTFKDRLSLTERRRMLRTSPIDGCVDDAECVDFAKVDAGLSSPDQPFNRQVTVESSWACAADPSRAPGPKTCQMTCTDDEACEQGWHCAGDGFCVEAPLPPAVCLKSLQRYAMGVGHAFRVRGSRSGYLHNRIADVSTGECIENPNGNPLLRGRIPLQAPACVGDGMNDLLPNPCTTTVEHAELLVPYTFTGTKCEAPEDENGEVLLGGDGLAKREVFVRTTSAIRFRNPAMTYHLVEPVSSGDLSCHGDRLGTRKPFATAYAGFQLAFNITGGSAPMFVGTLDTNGNRVRVGTAFPNVIEPTPDGTLWVLDQGDLLNPADPTRGRIVSITPASPVTGFDPVTLR